MVGARGLSIAWGNDTRYWKWKHIPESRFAEVAILKSVWWLDIHGKIASVMLSPNTLYGTYLVYRISNQSWGLSSPGKTLVSFREVRNEISNVCLQHPMERVALRNDGWSGWMEIELGEFYYDDGDESEIEMKFQEHHEYKGGLIVEGIEIRPK
ncbi:hypothetical protein E3N88_11916 [Mikania micrantha]|uniref:F-box domain-containing protein n=1 Tax=Mikania micrantha TaxID=192012 RepID=A0A5N6P5D2_9ASTR|nr:hypothetical protein E3N88_11916 [Mikania micrantha]